MRTLLFATVLALPLVASNPPSPGDFKNCPETGKPKSDEILNKLKNRSSAPSDSNAIVMADVLKLPIPPRPLGPRTDWSPAQLKVVEADEGRGAILEGFIVAVKQEGTESCNCGLKGLNDFHIWIAPTKKGPRATAMVVEMSPRWKASNPAWALNALKQLVNTSAHVRVTGWLMFDQEHLDEVGKTRGTVWELHPVTMFEVFTGGEFRELQ